ncbi:MAG: MarC family protein [Sodaliphilus sp.]|nr:MarC family protein [Sodaliphilus sp.]
MMEFFSKFDTHQMISAFIVLLAIIDIIGSSPIILSLRSKGMKVSATNCTLISTILLLLFYFGGNGVLMIFNVDISSFAIAGSLLIFFMALEMILDIEIFKNNGPTQEATIIPLVFPLVAGPGAFTALLSLKAMYADINILIALLLNMLWVFVVIMLTDKIKRFLGDGGIYFIRRFFGMILLAIAMKMFTSNISNIISH